MFIKAIHKIERHPKAVPPVVMPGDIAKLETIELESVLPIGAAIPATEEEVRLYELRNPLPELLADGAELKSSELVVDGKVTAENLPAGGVTADTINAGNIGTADLTVNTVPQRGKRGGRAPKDQATVDAVVTGERSGDVIVEGVTGEGQGSDSTETTVVVDGDGAEVSGSDSNEGDPIV